MANRILITHVGSLPRPHDLLDLMKSGKSYEARVTRAVEDVVRRQVESGIDIVSDGEQSKPGFYSYVKERLEGFEPRPGLIFSKASSAHSRNTTRSISGPR
jgi:5-methyltetrahydropteroyltriglutamate--homocysteine methyltransferase